MLDKFLAVSYSAGLKKTASRQLIDKLKEFPIDELKKLASGDAECKLAYAMDCAKEGSGEGTWLDKYKGTPLFAKAVEMEKQLLQLDMEDQARREQERAQQPQPSDTWAKRDAIQLQKRMLDLDLVMAQNGGDPTAGAPAEAVPPEAALEPPAPKEPKAPKEEPAAAPEGAAAGGEPSEEELLAALEQEQAGAGEGAPPQPPKPKAPPQQAQGEGEEEETEEGQPPKKDDKAKGMSVEVKQSAAKVAAIAISAGALLAKTAGSDAKLKREIAKKHPSLAKTAAGTPGQIIDALGHGAWEGADLAGAVSGGLKAHDAGARGLGTLGGAVLGGTGAVLGSSAGRVLGERGGDLLARATSPMGLSPGLAGAIRPAAAALGTVGGGLAGYKLLTRGYDRMKAENEAKAAKSKAKEEPASKEASPKVANILGALSGAASAAKGLATSANAAGGLPQVAKSFGNVAKNFAQKNPLAAAGIAGAGGLAAGKMLSNSQPRA